MINFNKKDAKYEGIFISTQSSFGFVKIEDENETDQNFKEVFIPGKDTLNALDNDKVLVQITKVESEKKAEAKVIKIIKHNTLKVVGIFQKQKNFGFVIPDNKRINFDIYIENKNSLRAKDKSKVVVQIIKFPKKKTSKPEGKILEILGSKNDPNVEILSIIKSMGIPYEFKKEVIKEAEEAAYGSSKNKKNKNSKIENKKSSNINLSRRKDLRKLKTITVDSESAKDLDDAISIEKKKNIYKLYVHIADVSNYVKEHSILDDEAYNRGTSVYLLDRVIPMLPKALSNDICSLNMGVDRNTLTCEMDINEKGEVISYDIYESIINVNMRMSYNGVEACVKENKLENGEDINEYNTYKNLLCEAYTLSHIIRKRREKRGAIEFNFQESDIKVDENLKPISISIIKRLESHKMIEDFMLEANETVAKDFYLKKIPFLYRVHEIPDKEKIKTLKEFVEKLGYNLNTKNEIHPKDIQKLLINTKKKKESPIIEKLTLRSLKQARYTNDNLGHFALAATHYCHFTSPIRRYPDLQIHRIIKENLQGTYNEKRKKHYDIILKQVGVDTSKCERRAIDAERDLIRLKECEYMHEFLGEEFDGTISSLTSFGIYVELDNTIEGLISLKDLKDDYYTFDEKNFEIRGERKNRRFQLGERLRVQVASASKEMRTIDFKLVE
ncbi:MAG: ribonuclease R [Eubacteriales bacterium]|nr:ribonuclease R [Eubacteriales bacterium]